MLTDAKLLQLVYYTATCYVPEEQLNEEQLERYDNIRYRWCKCRRCQKPLKIENRIIIPQYMGHANRKTLEICISRAVLNEHIDLPYSMFLLDLVVATLHEIVHILFPEFNEEETDNKAYEWLKKNKWVEHAEKFYRTAKAQFEQ